jgi:hypothetical protein
MGKSIVRALCPQRVPGPLNTDFARHQLDDWPAHTSDRVAQQEANSFAGVKQRIISGLAEDEQSRQSFDGEHNAARLDRLDVDEISMHHRPCLLVVLLVALIGL